MSKSVNVTGFAALVMFAFIIAIVIGLMLVFTGLAVGAANSWIIQGNFVDGWHAVWDRWFVSILWGLLFCGGAGGGSKAIR